MLGTLLAFADAGQPLAQPGGAATSDRGYYVTDGDEVRRSWQRDQHQTVTTVDGVQPAGAGDGAVHYYAQGPTFDSTSFNTVWNPTEDVNVDSRDYGRPREQTSRIYANWLAELPEVVRSRSRLRTTSTSGSTMRMCKHPEPRQGKLVVCWYNEDFGGYVPTYDTGMRLVFFAATSTNPNGWHVFGNYDMHETLPESRWHYYSGYGPQAAAFPCRQSPTSTSTSRTWFPVMPQAEPRLALLPERQRL